MSSFAEPIRSRSVSRLAIMVALAAGLAGCGSDFSRMSENPFSSRPQAQAPAPQPEYTGSVRQQHYPSQRVDSQPLSAPGSAPQQQYAQQQQPQQRYSQEPTYGGGAGVTPIQPPRPEYTGSVPAQPPRQPPKPQQNWSWDGGTAVIVAQGETLESISRRHGVPSGAIMQANNMGPASQVRPGQRLVIPRVQHQMGQAPAVSPPKTRVAGPLPSGGGNVHVTQPGETIYSLARRYQLTPMAIAKANNVGLGYQLKVGERITIPGGSGSAPRIAAAPAPQQQAPVSAQQPRQNVAAAQPAPPPVSKHSPKVAQVEPAASARVVTPAADPAPEPQATNSTPPSNAAPSFRWPVKGRVIEGFGKKGNGQQNDGINVAVPEGTPIKAAEDGVVAYAGNELKGYGNLVLVRHSNGYVTAYAHASELGVKKGDNIKRGQVIGKAGSTGNVTSPQLHFEVRKGATPVDPTTYLTGG
jgi:murein DD-endopeptidase MepM/ murein hydrolase activator NlpD